MQNTKVFSLRLVGVFILLILLGAIWLPTNHAHAENTACNDFTIIFARGSGGSYSSNEFTSLKNELASRIDQHAFTYKVLDLDQNILPDNQLNYEAVTVDPSTLEGVKNGLGSYVHFSSIGKYAKSAKSGVDLLFKYLSESPDITNCPDTRLVLSGYSQGAQVIGDALADKRMEPFKDRVAFTALFGDPKFHSSFNGQNAWLRGDVWPGQNGILGARSPYVPNDQETQTGSWCSDGDHICTHNLTEMSTSTHSNYPVTYIPQAASEIAAKLQGYYSAQGRYINPLCGAAKQDIVLAIDVSPAMRHTSDIFTYANPATEIMKSGCNVRVAIVGFDEPGGMPAQKLFDFTGSTFTLSEEITSLALPNDLHTRYEQHETQIREGISVAMDMPWRTDAQKVALVLGYGAGTTGAMESDLSQEVLRKSREAGGVEIYEAFAMPEHGISNLDRTGGIFSYFAYFNKATGGDLLRTNCWSPLYCESDNMDWDMSNLEAIKPTVAAPKIKAKVGEEVQLTALDTSAGLSKTSGYSSYWYLDCKDQANPQIVNSLSVTYTFTHTEKCMGAIVTSANPQYCYYCGGAFGRIIAKQSVTTFPIEILPADYKAPPTPGPIINISKTRYDDHLTVSWSPPENYQATGKIAYGVFDSDHSLLATTADTQISVLDLPKSQTEPVLYIQAGNAGANGPEASTAEVSTALAFTSQAVPTSKPTSPLSTTTAPETSSQSTAIIANDIVTKSPEIIPEVLSATSSPLKKVAKATSEPAHIYYMRVIVAFVITSFVLFLLARKLIKLTNSSESS